LPFAVPNGGDRRVYFSGRDGEGRSHVGACTLDLDTLTVRPGSSVIEPLLSPGLPGTFDEHGCSVACVIQRAGQDLLFYTGWSLGRGAPFTLAVGVAISEDGGHSFTRLCDGPVLGRHRHDPYLCASPSILIENGIWRMWYTSGVRWERSASGWQHYYHIKYAESADGVEWRRDGRVSIDFAHAGEHSIGRPHVVKQGNHYRMWYCWRGDHYRIGYAESPDGLAWRRLDEAAGSPEPADWDSEMQAYPMVFRDRDREIMLYNGNGYGATGFGYAERRIS
jgi:hypothetical protein